MSMLAFIINVGLFVKAKINLQNAVDAAAYSGAATQARQLTNIAYLNWELRNVYKEWMFKYYVLGQLSKLAPNNQISMGNLQSKNTVNYLLSVPKSLNFNSKTALNTISYDAYNAPSICIHNNTSKDICPLYMVPGLPRFESIGVAGISEIQENLINSLVSTKASDCSSRTKINFLAALSWAYGSGIKTFTGAPEVAANRPGAWPSAIELAMRIRNLEMIINRPPMKDGMNLNEAEALSDTASDIALNERPVKAFLSAFKNLSGGEYKDLAVLKNRGDLDELSANFRLTELAPEPYIVDNKTASGFLISPDFVYPGSDLRALTKHYLDLQVMAVNFATFYSSFTTSQYEFETGVKAEASCGISKTALPVPGYILGFTKNPEVITYYAVKGESKFVGLFFPFTGSLARGVSLTAYAAAKPYGGRIGPKLFEFFNNGQSLVARNDKDKKSQAYVSGLKPPSAGLGNYKVGYPIPFSGDFWSSSMTNATLGGIPGSGAKAFFSLPNMIYDFESEEDLKRQTGSTQAIQEITEVLPSTTWPNEKLGLYDSRQFLSLRKSLGDANPGTLVNADQVLLSIIKARRATKYDAINYLIPTPKDQNESYNAEPLMIAENANSNQFVTYRLFAPLVGPSTLYKNNNVLATVIRDYIDANMPAIDTYNQSLLKVANTIYNTANDKGEKLTTDAAKSFHFNTPSNNATPPALVDGNCAKDIASLFFHFFTRTNTACGIVPLSNMMVDYLAKNSSSSSGSGADKYFISTYYTGNDRLDYNSIMSAYYPGARHGVNSDPKASAPHPLGIGGDDAAAYSARRNFYSTKFFHLSKIIESPRSGAPTLGKVDYQSTPLLREADSDSPADLVGKVLIKNPLKNDASTNLNNSFFSDF